MTDKWDELNQKADDAIKQSKPEFLAIVEILKEEDGITVNQIFDKFNKNYSTDFEKRQIRYSLKVMEDYKMIRNELDKHTAEKFFYLVYTPGYVSANSAGRSFSLGEALSYFGSLKEKLKDYVFKSLRINTENTEKQQDIENTSVCEDKKSGELLIGVYMITIPDGRRYIGKSIDIHNRLRQHKRANFSYFEINHEVLVLCQEKELDYHERRFIRIIKPELNKLKY
jgi:hypothetical protein